MSNRKCLIVIFLAIFIPLISFSQKVDSVVVGKGGGITGNITVFKVTKNTAAKGSGLTDISYSAGVQIKKKEFRKIQSKAQQIYKTTDAFAQPSNMYKFLVIYCGGNSRKYTWGDKTFIVPEKIENLYNEVITIVNR